MIERQDINWYLQEPSRLLAMKPFTRGGNLVSHGWEGYELESNAVINTGFVELNKIPISQDTYLTEYDPDLHHIILNRSIPHIQVVLDGVTLPKGMMEITETASFQKLIHAAHVRNLTNNPLEITSASLNADESELKGLSHIKLEWEVRDNDWYLYQAIKTCKKVGNVGALFSYDPSANRYDIKVYSYEDGYQIIPNYDEFGNEIARTLAYMVDGVTYLDTFDRAFHYRIELGNDGTFSYTSRRHGFSQCPLLHKRGRVAWEYGESTIEMWELMANIGAIALKRFGTFALVFAGEMDTDSFKRDSSTLIINLSSDNTNGKQSADVLKFPEPQTMDKYLKTLEEKISLFTSTTFITPKDIAFTGSGGNGIALAMSNDYALASQSANDWRRFVRDMVALHKEGLELEEKQAYTKVPVSARIIPWSLETNNTKIINLTQEGTYLSTKTMLEKLPDAAPDEAERVIAERGALIPRDSADATAAAEKANNIAVNENNTIVDNIKREEEEQ